MTLIYCYGVVEKEIELDLKGFESENIYLIPFKDIIAVVSDVSEANFSQEQIDKNIKNMKWLAEYGQIHESVVDLVMQKTTIIPMKFCTIFDDKENVESMLEERYADFKFNLKNLKDKAEIGIKVYFDAEPLKQKILEESAEIKELEKAAEKKSKGAAYFDKQKIDMLIKDKLQQKLAGNRTEIFNKIKALAEDSKENELLNKKLTKKDMMLNAVFLINKNGLDQFKNNVEKIKSESKDFELEVYGPFPCYNFVK
jgi:hypothetical protein